jgi:hypothetical protein
MFELTEEQAIELQRLQAIVTEKRTKYLELEQRASVSGNKDANFLEELKSAEEALKVASYAFNDFTGSLPLRKKSG